MRDKLSEELNKFKKLTGLNEANKTPCQTPDAIFDTVINGKEISCTVKLPMDLDLSEDEAKVLETNIHNAMELVLSKYFVK